MTLPSLPTGQYEILGAKPEGEGGMGSIFKVRHRRLDHIRAAKVMRSFLAGDATARQRFENEARLAADLRHHNIAQVYDYSIGEDGTAFIILEWVEGRNLRELVDTLGAPPVAWTLEIAEQALSALAYLHSKGIVHRDIAPDNMMVVEVPDQGFQLKLVDLGIARRVDSRQHLTKSGHFIGKLRYAPPEAISKAGHAEGLDRRSDLYSLAVVLYYLLTAQLPIEGSDEGKLISGIVFDPPRPFCEVDPDGRVPEELRRIILRALSKRAEDRFQTAEEFAHALAQERRQLSDSHEVGQMNQGATVGSRLLSADDGADLESDQDRINRQFQLGHELATQPLRGVFDKLLEESARIRTLTTVVLGKVKEKPARAAATTAAALIVVLFSIGIFSSAAGLPEEARLPVPIVRQIVDPLENDLIVPEGTVPLPESETHATVGEPVSIPIVCNDPELGARLVAALGRAGTSVSLSTSLVAARRTGAELALRLTASRQQGSVESYGNLLSLCEVTANAEVVQLRGGTPTFSKVFVERAPTCAPAMALAAERIERAVLQHLVPLP